MSLTGISTSLLIFKTKIEEAVGLVPEMGAEDKLKAVQFWNVVSEKLQEIVNNSAADISALAMKMEKQEEAKEKLLEEQQKAKEAVPDQSKKLPLANSNPENTQMFTSPAPSSFTAPTPNFTGQNPPIEKQMPTNPTVSEPQLEYLTSQAPPLPPCSVSATPQNANMESLPSQRSLDADGTLKQPNLAISLDTLSQVAGNSESSINSEQRLVISELQQDLTSRILETLLINPNKKDNQMNPDAKSEAAVAEAKKSILKKSPPKPKASPEPTQQNATLGSSPKSRVNNNNEEGSQEISNDDENHETGDRENNDASDDEDLEDGEEDEELVKNTLLKEGGKNEGVIIPKKGKKDKGSLTCEWCFKQFTNNSALTSHRWVHTKPYTCSDCDACFSTRGNLVVHQRRHTGEKPFPCTLCDARFSTKGNLKRHIKTHSGSKPWTCSLCGGRFTEKKSLKVHMRRHTGEKPYECEVCGKRFSQTGILQTHMAMHLDKKSHLCEHCGKSFRQKSQLRLHMMRHNGVRNHVCAQCPAKFLTKGDLERHNRIHTGERPFICELCGKTFTRQQSLNEHKNRHYGLKPYSCKYCGKVFAEMSACYKHVKQHEKIKHSSSESPQVTMTNEQMNIPVYQNSNSNSLQLSGTNEVDQIVEVHHANFTDSDSHKFTVLVHTGDQQLEVASEMTVVPDQVETILPNEQRITLAVPNHITDFATISLLASASTYQ